MEASTCSSLAFTESGGLFRNPFRIVAFTSRNRDRLMATKRSAPTAAYNRTLLVGARWKAKRARSIMRSATTTFSAVVLLDCMNSSAPRHSACHPSWKIRAVCIDGSGMSHTRALSNSKPFACMLIYSYENSETFRFATLFVQ